MITIEKASYEYANTRNHTSGTTAIHKSAQDFKAGAEFAAASQTNESFLRVLSWWQEGMKQRAGTAFTAGLERTMAQLVETVLDGQSVTIGYTREQMEEFCEFIGKRDVVYSKMRGLWYSIYNLEETITTDRLYTLFFGSNSLPVPASLPSEEECMNKAHELSTSDVELHIMTEFELKALIQYSQTHKK